ncbi:unnamed protein product [Zymoseptoria tritici ST99CH_3D1]|nr:unnamed protein product [Zymoseptoria tritici ST99CH_3D1]
MQHEHHRVPVTALGFWHQDVLLAAEGTFIKAYDVKKKILLAKVEVFNGQAVHGILVSDERREDSQVIVWGGRLLRQLRARLSGTTLELDLDPLKKADDWILDAAFAPVQAEKAPKIAIVTAHNSLSIGTLDDALDIKLDLLVPGSNCILYAADVTWLSADECLIASGTAFGDIMVWSCNLTEDGGILSVKHGTHYTFSAHDGSVFGVQISSKAVASTFEGRMHVLASCSDDRTIRLWDISDLSPNSSTLAEGQRETGFGSHRDGDEHAPQCLAKAMGHGSRIWTARFLLDETNKRSAPAGIDELSIVSFGEDASCIFWTPEPTRPSIEQHPYVLRQTHMQKSHTGKNIWSVTIDPSLRIATGGADGSIAIRSWPKLRRADRPSEVDRKLLLCGQESDSFRTFAFLSHNSILATTDSGRLVTLQSHGGVQLDSKEVSSTIDGLRGYSTMASVPGYGFAAGNQGDVYSYVHRTGRITKILSTGRKIASLFADSEHAEHLDQSPEWIGLLVTQVNSDSALLCTLLSNSVAVVTDDQSDTVTRQIELALPENFVVTSYARTTLGLASVVVLGSRNGSIAMFDVSSTTGAVPITHTSLLTSVHGKEAVTSLKFAGSSVNSRHVLFSTGRDGTYAAHAFQSPVEKLQTQLVHQLSLPFGPNIEGIGHSPAGHIWLWGFRSKQFVVFDITSQQEVMTVECGGAHRTWAFQPLENGGTFFWIKASKLYWKSQIELPFQTLNAGGHGREIKAVAVSRASQQLIATGAEDTNIKLSTYNKRQGFQTLHTLQKHNTGIQHLQWSPDGLHLFSSGGFEEFYVWKIALGVPELGIGVVCQSAHPNSGRSDLRITHFSAHPTTDTPVESPTFHITMTYSDSMLRTWSYHDRNWALLSQGSYLTSCLTQVLSPPPASGAVPSNGDHNPAPLITASTDGYLAIWSAPASTDALLSTPAESEFKWHQRHKAHQNSILSLTALPLPDGTTLLLSTGDDNALGITRLQISDTGSRSEAGLRTLLVPNAHAAAITGLVVLSHKSVLSESTSMHSPAKEELVICTTSLDQRLKLWRVKVDISKEGVDGVDVRFVGSRFSAVADCAGVEGLRAGSKKDGDVDGVLVFGVGMEIWRVGELELVRAIK